MRERDLLGAILLVGLLAAAAGVSLLKNPTVQGAAALMPGARWYAIRYIFGPGRWTWSQPLFRDGLSMLQLTPAGSELWSWGGSSWSKVFP